MSALIDDIGWTLYVSEHSIIDAKDYISDGLAIAEGLGDYYYVAKGYRHLASIERSLGNLNIAKQWLVFADYYADWIENDSSKREMKASLMLSRAKLHGLNNVASEKEVAIEIAEEVAEEYVELSCPDRAVKSYRFIGEMYEALGQHERAMDYFSRGRREAKKVDRIDELEMNAMKISSQLSRYLEDSRA
jgi:tetratricopeptide (TPR) repeat protein